MNIGITVDGKNLDSIISDKLKECKCLLIVNIGDHLVGEVFKIVEVTAIKNLENDLGEKLAKELIIYDCEAVITGELEPSAFDMIADAGITRYCGAGYPAAYALELMEKQLLKLIRNVEGNEDCDGSHHNHEI